MILNSARDYLDQVRQLCISLDNESYTAKLQILNGASIGAHIRHILEFYICLLHPNQGKFVSYDNRKRDQVLEKERTQCVTCIDQLLCGLESNNDREITVLVNYANEKEETKVPVASSFYRELAFNIEHTIHHLALIKIGIQSMKIPFQFKENFGIAPSTIRNGQRSTGQ